MASGKHQRTPIGVVSHRRGRQLWRYELKEKSRGFLRSCRVGGWWRGPFCVVRPVAAPEQGLWAPARDGRGHDLQRDEPHPRYV